MNRDHGLFLLIGLLAGFLVGYIAHEQVAGVQPARIAPGGVDAAGPMTAAAGGAPVAGAPGGADPRMAEIQRLRAVLEQNPDDRDALLTLANLNFDIQNWPRAQELYERLLKLDPSNPDVMTDLGIALRSQGQFPRALELFRAARQLQPAHWQSLFNETIVLAFDLKDFAGAEKAIAELRVAAPGNPDVQRLADEVKRLRESGG